MEAFSTDEGAGCEAAVFLGCFEDLPDPRQRGKVMYPLDEVLLLSLLAVLAGAETFVDIARFGAKTLSLLRRFRPFVDGTPSHDHLGDIFASLDAEHFQRCFVALVSALTGVPTGVIAGKHPASFYEDMWFSLVHRGYWQGEIWNRRKSGEIYAEWLAISLLRDEQGNVTHHVAFFPT